MPWGREANKGNRKKVIQGTTVVSTWIEAQGHENKRGICDNYCFTHHTAIFRNQNRDTQYRCVTILTFFSAGHGAKVIDFCHMLLHYV